MRSDLESFAVEQNWNCESPKMCGRFTLRTPTKQIASLFDDLEVAEIQPRYNIAPTQQVTCVRNDKEGHPMAVELRWGLIPFWAKDTKIGAKMINARSETIAEKPAFRAAFKKRRCLVIADGFYEWKKVGKSKFPHYITRADDQPFCMAGLWERWTKDETPIESCTVITTQANEIMEPLHHRMPVILPASQYDFWLDTEFSDRDRLEEILVPCPSEDLATREVSQIVNKATNETPECIEPARSLFD